VTFADRTRPLWNLAVKAQIPVIALTIAALAWPFVQLSARDGLDRSWQVGLHLVATSSLRQGVDFAFTYGPLGFLTVPQPYLGFTSLLALITSFALYAALVATMLVFARRIMPIWLAALVTLVIARFFSGLFPPEAFQALAFVLAVEAIIGTRSRQSLLIPVLLGVLAGVALLVKLNVGVYVAAVGAIAVLTGVTPAWRGLADYGGSAAGTTLALWLLTGQRLTDLVPYGWTAYQTISAYSEAMGSVMPPDNQWTFIAFAAILPLIAWAAWQLRVDWTTRQRIGLVAVGAVFAYAMWKAAFTREHPAIAFATFAIILFPLARPALNVRVWVVSLVCAGIAFGGATRYPLGTYLDAPKSLTSLVAEVREAVFPRRAAQAAERTRTQLRSRYALPQSMLAAVAGHRVHIDPWEAAMAYAYPEFSWAPLPVFQSYVVWTPYLDELNAERLRSPEAPDRILREFRSWTDPPDSNRRQLGRALRPGEELPVTLDGRFRWFESPAATLEIFCRYRQVASTSRWQVLERTGTSCGPAQLISVVTAQAGTAVPVPQASTDAFVVVRIHGITGSVQERLKSILYKGTEWNVKLDDTRYRLVPGTAADGLILAVPPSVDGSYPFAFGAPIRTISVSAGIDGRESRASLTYEFQRVPLGP
jgi:hypothetical protein